MCLDILRSPVKAIAKAKQKRDINRTIMALLEIGIIFAVAVSVMAAQTTANLTLLIGSFLSSFSVFVIIAVVLGWAVKIAAVNLGGRGGFYEGFTALTYALVPFSVVALVIAALLYVPVIGSLLAFLATFPALASMLSILYRGVKELYNTDMITAFVTVSITITVFVLATLFLSSSLLQAVL